MPNPRVRFDEMGEPKVCLVKVPRHLAKILYRAALRARQGRGGIYIEESEIVISLIEEWAKGEEPVTWDEVLRELKSEAEVAERAGVKTGRGAGKKIQPKSPEDK